jgi:Bax protein
VLKFRLLAAAVLISVAFAIYVLGTPNQGHKPLTRSVERYVTAQNFPRIPRHFEDRLPADLASWPVAARKRVFVDTVLPLVLQENEHLLADRGRVMTLAARQAQGRRLTTADKTWLAQLSTRYRVTPGDLAALLQRVDMVPPSLALAQAVEESGWGTSRFARDGNALFGQWTFTQGAGIVPLGREAGDFHEVKKYLALKHSVRDYVNNLNTHRAYTRLRRMRARFRAGEQTLSGYALSTALIRYSARGEDYVRSLQSIIRVNELGRFDNAQLGGQLVATLNY